MKPTLTLLLLLLFASLGPVMAQEYNPETTYLVIKSDGARFVGQILSSDAREIFMRTSDRGEIIIPKHEISSITEYNPDDDRFKEIFASRYFLTTNALPIDEGDSYIQWTLIGPDVHFGLANNMSVGVMTTWLASPVLGSFKYSKALSENTSYALGVLAGTTLWNFGDGGSVALPYAAYTIGGETSNFSVSAGYGVSSFNGITSGQALFSVGGMRKISRAGTFVFDSLIFSSEQNIVTIIIPGIRLQTQEKSAFQFGFPGFFESGRRAPLGFPVVSWFRRL